MRRIGSLMPCLAIAVTIAIGLFMAPATSARGRLDAIGVSVVDLGNPFFVKIASSIEKHARELSSGPVDVDVVSSAYDLARQKAQVDDFIRQKVDLIVLTAAEYRGIEGAVERAHAAGIPVIAVDVDAAGADVTVTTDNAQAGALACRRMAERLGGHGRVAIINGPPVSSVHRRVAGCRQVLARYPGLTLVSAELNGGGSRAGGLEKMTDLLIRETRLDAVFTINDPTAFGAEAAARQAGRTDLFIVSVDGSPTLRSRLLAGDSLILGSAAQLPGAMARRAIDEGWRLVHGQSPSRKVIRIPAKFMTQDNARKFTDWETRTKPANDTDTAAASR